MCPSARQHAPSLERDVCFDGFLRLMWISCHVWARPVGADLQYAQIERAEAVADRFEMLAEARAAAEVHAGDRHAACLGRMPPVQLGELRSVPVTCPDAPRSRSRGAEASGIRLSHRRRGVLSAAQHDLRPMKRAGVHRFSLRGSGPAADLADAAHVRAYRAWRQRRFL